MQFNTNKNIIPILVILLITCILTAIVSPGLFYSDTYSRIYVGWQLTNYPYFITTITEPYLTHVSIIPSLLIGIIEKYTGSYVYYTLLTTFTYLVISYFILKKLTPNNAKLACIIFLLHPILLLMSTWNALSIISGAIIGGLILLLNKKLKWYDYILFFIFSTILFSFRENAITVLPLIFFYLIIKKNTTIKQKTLCITSILLALLLIFTLPKAFPLVKKCPLYSGGFAWELLNTIDKIPQDEKYKYTQNIANKESVLYSLDKIKIYNRHINVFFWERRSDLSLYKITLNNTSKDIIKSYLSIAKDYPKEFIQTKIFFISNTLGINHPLNIDELNYNKWGKMDDLKHFNNTPIRKYYYKFLTTKSHQSLIRYPYIIFLISLGLLIFAKRKKLENIPLYTMFYLFAIFYYGAFLITTHSFEIRYFFPSYYLMCLMNISIITELYSKYKNNEKLIRFFKNKN